MNPFYFGSSESPLYGVYHPPRSRGVRDTGIVLCYPFGVEYMRAHRAFRQLSMLLARAGHHVLRFDYSCTGDSAGPGEDGSLARWTADIDAAIGEIRETAAVDRVSVIGLRLGAALALRAAAGRDDVERVILWDPIGDGEAYVRDLCRLYLGPDSYPDCCAPERLREVPVGLSGYPLTESLLAELRALTPDSLAASADSPLTMVVSADRPEWRDLHGRLAARHAGAELHVVPSDGSWAEGDMYGSALLPQAIIQAIVSVIAGKVSHV